MRLIDSRRLTGANLMSPSPLAVMEVAFEHDGELEAWQREVTRVVSPEALVVRQFPGGAALGIVVEPDELLAATNVNEWALGQVNGASESPATVAAALEAARNPSLRALLASARSRDLPTLLDDTELTIGMAARSVTYPMSALPATADVPWNHLGRIPVALVTGTNGKTTCARMLARVLERAGRVCGLASSGGIVVHDQLVDAGDWTGPAAARMILRRPDVTVAVLETARGGILRRGLAVERCDAALITNVSEDHFGDYGVFDLQTMATVKAVVGRAVPAGGKLVLGAACDALMELPFAATPILFALDGNNARVQALRAQGGEAWFVDGGWLARAQGTMVKRLLPVADIPITFGGSASFNVENALGVAALASALGVSDENIEDGLRHFQPSATDNPGRGNLQVVAGIRVLLDFAHNPEGLRAAMSLVEALRGPSRLLVVFAQPGDRTDDAIVSATKAVLASQPDRVFLHDMPEYLRGRPRGESTEVMARAAATANVSTHPDEITALTAAFAEAIVGDLVVVVPHLEVEAITKFLSSLAS